MRFATSNVRISVNQLTSTHFHILIFIDKMDFQMKREEFLKIIRSGKLFSSDGMTRMRCTAPRQEELHRSADTAAALSNTLSRVLFSHSRGPLRLFSVTLALARSGASPRMCCPHVCGAFQNKAGICSLSQELSINIQ